MTFVRSILIALAVLLPTTWTLAHAEDAPAPAKTDKKADKKEKKAEKKEEKKEAK